MGFDENVLIPKSKRKKKKEKKKKRERETVHRGKTPSQTAYTFDTFLSVVLHYVPRVSRFELL